MKQGELAERVGVRRETIIRLEKGQYVPSLKLGHYTLTELLERLYRATGAAEFKRQLDENEEQIRAKGL